MDERKPTRLPERRTAPPDGCARPDFSAGEGAPTRALPSGSSASQTDARRAGERSDLSRRRFLQTMGLATAVAIPEKGLLGNALPPAAAPAQDAQDEAHGPGPVAVTLNVNGKDVRMSVEPRVTLLDALRNAHLAGSEEFVDLTGSKRVCDRASCGACTLLVDGRTMYSCTLLAIDAQGRKIRTVEGLAEGDKLHPVQQAFIDHDGLMCGFCTPGFVVSSAALLERNPDPSREEIRRGLDGNICRCGTQCRVIEAVEDAARVLRERR